MLQSKENEIKNDVNGDEADDVPTNKNTERLTLSPTSSTVPSPLPQISTLVSPSVPQIPIIEEINSPIFRTFKK